jgi:hypothetical protein
VRALVTSEDYLGWSAGPGFFEDLGAVSSPEEMEGLGTSLEYMTSLV